MNSMHKTPANAENAGCHRNTDVRGAQTRSEPPDQWREREGEDGCDIRRRGAGPENVMATEKSIGTDVSAVKPSSTFADSFAIAANKAEGFTTTSTPEPANG